MLHMPQRAAAPRAEGLLPLPQPGLEGLQGEGVTEIEAAEKIGEYPLTTRNA